jgi:hypothetical protein
MKIAAWLLLFKSLEKGLYFEKTHDTGFTSLWQQEIG